MRESLKILLISIACALPALCSVILALFVNRWFCATIILTLPLSSVIANLIKNHGERK